MPSCGDDAQVEEGEHVQVEASEHVDDQPGQEDDDGQNSWHNEDGQVYQCRSASRGS